MKRYISWSGGKDSTASIILAHENNIHIDLVIISLPFFDIEKGIYADHHKHIEWVFSKAIPTIESWSYPVKVVSSDKDYKYWFFKQRGDKCKNKENNGKHYGWLINGLCKMNGEKVEPIKEAEKELGGWQSIIGIGIDEPIRLERLHNKPNTISLLEQYKYTTDMTRDLCEKYGLLSPYYELGNRQGCWFCPNQSIKQMAKFSNDYPHLWQELVELNKLYIDNPSNFCKRGFKYSITFSEIMREITLINNQMTIFDFMEK